jgi:hypothetical protein
MKDFITISYAGLHNDQWSTYWWIAMTTWPAQPA